MSNKNELTFKEFKHFMNEIIKNEKYIDECARLNVNIFEELTYSDLAVKLLQKLTNDKNEWISWWIWEKNQGTDENIKAFDETDNEIPSKTIKDLWNLIQT